VVAARLDRYQRLLDEIRAEFPRFALVRKDESPLSRAIHVALAVLTLGGMRRYLTGYQTTIGWTVYVTPDWERRTADERWVIMRHEREHLRQFRRYTRLGMSVLYLLVPLPMGLAYFRARFEQAAYRETLRATAELHGAAGLRDPALRASVIRQFTGPSYGWMWPFPRAVARWYDGVVTELEAAA
jgi:hypothetical protein